MIHCKPIQKSLFFNDVFQYDPRIQQAIQKELSGNFPGGLVVKIPPSNAGDRGLILGWGTNIPHAWDN